MTTFLDRPRIATGNHLPEDAIDTLPLPVIDIADGYRTGLKLTEAIETLANEAEEIGVPYDSDGTLQIGDASGDHIVIEQDIVDARGGEPSSVVNTLVIAAPSKKKFFRFQSTVRSNGDLVKFRIDEESQGATSQHGEFSGVSGSMLPPDAVSPVIHFTETMIEVTDALYKKSQIGEVAHEEVVEHLAAPDSTQHDQSTRVMGSTALGKLLTNLGLYRAAA